MIDADDAPPPPAASPLALLAREDLDRLSTSELDQRLAALEAEAARTRAKRAAADALRSTADALFRRG